VKDGVHKTAQLELDLPADRKPVQLKKTGGDMLACAELELKAAIRWEVGVAGWAWSLHGKHNGMAGWAQCWSVRLDWGRSSIRKLY